VVRTPVKVAVTSHILQPVLALAILAPICLGRRPGVTGPGQGAVRSSVPIVLAFGWRQRRRAWYVRQARA